MAIVDRFGKRIAQTDEPEQPESQPEGVEPSEQPEQPVETEQVEEPRKYDPVILEQAISSHDEILKKRFDQLAIHFEYAAGLSQESGNRIRTRFYGHFRTLVQQLKAEFEKELKSDGNYEGPQKARGFGKDPNLKPWHDPPKRK